MRIAVIEDERPIREGLVHILNKISPEYQVVGSAENGREGLILLEEQDPDLILLDIQMPDMNGLQMLKEARERGSMTKVVILTAYSDFDYAKKAIALGIENYLLKPVNLTELKNTLSKIKEEIFVEQRGKNSLSLETVIKDALEGEYEEDSRLEETLLEKYGFSGRKHIYCMYLFMGKYYDSEQKEAELLRQRLQGLNLLTSVQNYQDRRESLQRLLVTTTKNTMNGNRVRLEKAQDALLSLDTSRIVARGYAIVKKDDKPLTSTKNITEGDQLTVQMKDGELEVEVKNVN